MGKIPNFDPVKPTILLDAHLDTVRPKMELGERSVYRRSGRWKIIRLRE